MSGSKRPRGAGSRTARDRQAGAERPTSRRRHARNKATETHHGDAPRPAPPLFAGLAGPRPRAPADLHNRRLFAYGRGREAHGFGPAPSSRQLSAANGATPPRPTNGVHVASRVTRKYPRACSLARLPPPYVTVGFFRGPIVAGGSRATPEAVPARPCALTGLWSGLLPAVVVGGFA